MAWYEIIGGGDDSMVCFYIYTGMAFDFIMMNIFLNLSFNAELFNKI